MKTTQFYWALFFKNGLHQSPKIIEDIFGWFHQNYLNLVIIID